MTDDLLIKSARPEDADRAAVLLYSASTHRPLPEDGESWFVERLEHCFREAGNRFSYQNIQVAEQYGEVVGLVLSGWRAERKRGSTQPLAGRWNASRRRRSGMSMRWQSLPIGAAGASARVC